MKHFSCTAFVSCNFFFKYQTTTWKQSLLKHQNKPHIWSQYKVYFQCDTWALLFLHKCWILGQVFDQPARSSSMTDRYLKFFCGISHLHLLIPQFLWKSKISSTETWFGNIGLISGKVRLKVMLFILTSKCSHIIDITGRSEDIKKTLMPTVPNKRCQKSWSLYIQRKWVCIRGLLSNWQTSLIFFVMYFFLSCKAHSLWSEFCHTTSFCLELVLPICPKQVLLRENAVLYTLWKFLSTCSILSKI